MTPSHSGRAAPTPESSASTSLRTTMSLNGAAESALVAGVLEVLDGVDEDFVLVGVADDVHRVAAVGDDSHLLL